MKLSNILAISAFYLILFTMANVGNSKDLPEYLPPSTYQAPLYEDHLKTLYKHRSVKRTWSDNDVEDLNEAIQIVAYENGMEPAQYTILDIPEDISDEEYGLLVNNSLMHFMNELKQGSIQPSEFDPMIFLPPERLDMVDIVADISDDGDFERAIARHEPQNKDYQILKEHLAKYRKADDASYDLPQNAIVNPGETHEIIPAVRKRLENTVQDFDGRIFDPDVWVDKARFNVASLKRITNLKAEKASLLQQVSMDAEEKEQDAQTYDKNLSKRVAEFQYYNGLKVDGIIGPETLRTMNITPQERAEQIMLSLERLRWLPELEDKYLFVNIAGFHVKAYEHGKEQFTMPIIVGKVAHQTPVFSSIIKNVKMHPDWTSPDSIAERYVIPKIQENPKVIQSLGYQIQDKQTGDFIPWEKANIENLHKIDLTSYQFRQKPGLNNALGLARFSIENEYAIFMHGTPTKHLFNEENRTYSSGCIRLEDPLKMALFLLEGTDMDEGDIKDLYYIEPNEHPDTTIINLDEDIPVHIMYSTAWVDNEGALHFEEDVYGRDEKLTQALEM